MVQGDGSQPHSPGQWEPAACTSNHIVLHGFCRFKLPSHDHTSAWPPHQPTLSNSVAQRNVYDFALLHDHGHSRHGNCQASMI